MKFTSCSILQSSETDNRRLTICVCERPHLPKLDTPQIKRRSLLTRDPPENLQQLCLRLRRRIRNEQSLFGESGSQP